MGYSLEDSGLEPSKIQAICSTEQPLLVIAAPGSGKTRTLIERTLYLLLEKEIDPASILIATFTEKAASELITRVTNRLLELDSTININEMHIGTLHSIFLRLLEEHREHTRLKRNYRVLDDFEQAYLVYQNQQAFNRIENIEELYSKRTVWGRTSDLVSHLNKVREERVKVGALKSSGDNAIRALGEAIEVYADLLEQENCLDFTGIQSEMLRMIETYPEVLGQIQESIQYLMIDEYQDTNTIQETILLKLADNHKRICVVGDDDQSLYRFRGATVQNILAFAKNFDPGVCRTIQLENNYRSHPGIIDFYSEWMTQIPGNWIGDEGQLYRYPKEIQARDQSFPDYTTILKVSSDESPSAWHQEVYGFLQSLQEQGKITDYNQVAFLFRSVTNEKVQELAGFLEAQGIPVYSPRSNQFFDRPEIKLVIGALLFIFHDWKEITKLPNDIILKEWAYYDECFEVFSSEVKGNLAKHKPLLQFCALNYKEYNPLQKSTPRTLSNLFYELLQFPMFAEILDVDLNGGVLNQRAAFNLSAFSRLLVKYEYLHRIDVFTPKTYEKHLKNFLNSYLRFLIVGGITEYEGFEEYAPSGNVSFMTIHQSKGLEFPVVLVGSLNLNPRKQYTDLDEMLQADYYEREAFEPIDQTKNFDFWRLFYTAFSRAKNLLVLTGYEQEGRGQGALPSKAFRKCYEPLESWRTAELEDLPQESVKPVSLKGEYSFTSDILLYENCPLQYKFFKSLDFTPIRHGTALFGTLVHQTIEDIHKAVLRGEENIVTPTKIENWFNVNYQTLSKNLRTYLNDPQLKDALKQIQAYAHRNGNDWSKLKEAEVDVSLVKESFILRGKVDLVRGDNNTVDIVDFKTGKKLDVNNLDDRQALEKYRRQLEIYAHLIKERHGLDISKMHVYYTSEMEGIPTISYDYRESSVAESISNFSSVVDQIENNDYSMANTKKTRKLCENCDMQFYCNQRI